MVGDILSPTHLLFVLVVALVVLGPKKLPEVGRQLGNGLRDFRAAINGEHTESEKVQAPYEQAAPDTTGADHEFAHQPTGEAASTEHDIAHQPAAEATATEHEFAHQPAAEAAPTDHEFAHEPAADATSTEHEFAHQTETAAVDKGKEHAQKTDSGHEFAYETSESSDKRTDPLT